jgi:hypothetical protein
VSQDREFYVLAAGMLVLCGCVLLQSAALRKMRADVDFLTVVSRESLRSTDHA